LGASVFFADTNELATLTNTFKVGTTPTDPSTVSLAVTDPLGATTTYTYAGGTVSKTTTGIYTKDVACSSAGEWSYKWTGTGTAADVELGTWTVQETQLGRLYVTPQMLKSRLGIPQTDITSDYELHAACFAASRAIEQYCERVFYRTASSEVRTFVPAGWYELPLPAFSDLVSITTLATDNTGDGVYETTWATSDYQLLPVNPQAAPETKPYERIRAVGTLTFPLMIPLILARLDRVQITGVFGWPAVPQGVRMAAAILAAETFRLKDAPFGIATFGDMGAIRVRQNPMVEAFAAPYQRQPIRIA
jgi:hypothetical protein